MDPVPPPLVLLDQLAEAPHAFDGWTRALSRLQIYLPSSGVSVIIRGARPDNGDYYRRFGLSFDSAVEKAYVEHWQHEDPLAARVSQARSAEIFITQRADGVTSSACYNEWARPGGIASAMVSKICEVEGLSYWIALNRDHRMPAFDDDESDKLRVLFPHLRSALLVEAHVERDNARSESIEHMLDSFDEATFVIDGRGCITMLNQRARRLVHDGGLPLSVDRFRLPDDENDRALQAWLAGSAGVVGRVCRVIRVDAERPPLRLMKVPLPRAAMGDTRSLLFVRPLDAPPTLVSVEELTAVLDLSPAEASVAHAVARGEDLPAIASQLGTTVGTIRNQLKRIFTKLGIHRQAELVAAVHSMTPRVVPRPEQGAPASGSSRSR